jgi:uncharacterized protein with beta-barrel porin domain
MMMTQEKLIPKNILRMTALLLGNMVIAYPVSAQEVSTAVTTKIVIGIGSGLEVTSNGSISVTSDDAVVNAGNVTFITNNGTITTNTDGTDAIYIDGTVSGAITNNGTISNTNSNSDDDSGIEINQGYVTGAITNNGTITSSADNGIAVWGNDDGVQGDNLGVVLGGIVNNGTITGYGEGIDIDDDALINNGITNNGTIIGQNASAIEIDEYSVVNGGILNNSGTITGQSDSAIEINTYSVVNGGILNNNGTISGGSGGGGPAILIDDHSVVNGGILNNSGTIIGVSDSAIEIDDYSVVNGGILNDSGGVIKSNSNSSSHSAINIKDSAILNDGVINYGTIQSTTYGIAIYDDAELTGGITNYGSITVNYDAIYVDGELTGDITNHGSITSAVSAIAMYDDADVTGTFINYGTIHGNNNGIYLDETGELTGDITNYGSITSDVDALDFTGNFVFSGDLNNYGTIMGADTSIVVDSNAVISGKIYNYEGGKIVGLLAASPLATVDFDNSGLLVLKSNVTSGSEKTTGDIGTSAFSALTGDYVQSSTGEINLAVDTDATAGTTYSQFNITGSATLSSNAKISLDVKNSGVNISNADSFDNVLTTTGTLTSSSFNVTDNIMSLNFTAVNDGTGNIDITASSTGLTTVAAATTGAGAGAAKVFDNCLANSCSDEDFTNVTIEISSLSSAGEVNSAMEQTVPILTGGMQTATMNASHGVNKVIQSRLASNSGLSTGDNFVISGKSWAKPFMSWADQGNRGGVAGYDVFTKGIVVGRDTEIGDKIRVGGAFAFAHSDVKSKSRNSQKSANNMHQLIGYGSYALDEKTEFSFQADAGIIKNNGTRHISLGAIERDAHANYTTRLAHVGSGLGRTFDIKEGHTLASSIRVDYTWSEDQAYTETGADSLNLIVDKNSSSSFVLSTDVKYGFSLVEGNAISLTAGVGYDFLAERNTTTAAFQGSTTSSFDTKGMDIAKVLFTAGAGYTTDCGEVCEMTMRYDTEIKQDFMSNTVSAKLRWAF